MLAVTWLEQTLLLTAVTVCLRFRHDLDIYPVIRSVPITKAIHSFRFVLINSFFFSKYIVFWKIETDTKWRMAKSLLNFLAPIAPHHHVIKQCTYERDRYVPSTQYLASTLESKGYHQGFGQTKSSTQGRLRPDYEMTRSQNHFLEPKSWHLRKITPGNKELGINLRNFTILVYQSIWVSTYFCLTN